MTINVNTKGKVIISMTTYVAKILNNASEGMTGQVSTLVMKHLFKVKSQTEKLEEERALTAKLVFYCERVYPDIQTAVACLTTQVMNPDVKEWKNTGKDNNEPPKKPSHTAFPCFKLFSVFHESCSLLI